MSQRKVQNGYDFDELNTLKRIQTIPKKKHEFRSKKEGSKPAGDKHAKQERRNTEYGNPFCRDFARASTFHPLCFRESRSDLYSDFRNLGAY